MKQIQLTREIAWAASGDKANRVMRKGGRSVWSRGDYDVMVAEFDKLWPIERDIQTPEVKSAWKLLYSGRFRA